MRITKSGNYARTTNPTHTLRTSLAIILSICLTLTMMPAGVFATSWGDGSTEREEASDVIVDYDGTLDFDNNIYPDKINKINYKTGTMRPFTIVNIDDEIGNKDKEIDEDMKAVIVKHEMRDWITLAEKIYKSQSNQDDSKRGPAYIGIFHDYPYYFEDGNNTKHGKVDLVQYMGKDKAEKDSYLTVPPMTKWWWETTDYRKASSLNDLRDKTAEFCVKAYQEHAYKKSTNKKFTKDNLLSRRGDGGDLDSLKNTDRRDVYYKLFSHNVMELAEADNTQYNVFGVALYDLEVAPLAGDGLNFGGQKEHLVPGTGDKEKSFWVDHKMTSPGVETATVTIGEDETHSVGKTQTSGWSWGVQAGAKFSLGFGKDSWPVKGSGEINFSGDFNKMQENSLNEGYQQTNTGSYSSEFSFPLDAHTSTKVTQKHSKNTGYIKYDAPVVIRYKIAIFSMGGTYQFEFNTWGHAADFCTFFDGSSTASWDAVSSLYERSQSGELGGDPGGSKTYGYVNKKKKTSELDWTCSALKDNKVQMETEEGKTETVPMSEFIKNRAEHMPMLGVGSQIDVTEDAFSQSNEKAVPLFPLKEIRVDGLVEREYSMVVGETMSLDHFDVMGYDNDPTYGSVPYAGFTADSGDWKVADKDRSGRDLPEGIISMTRDPNSGSVKIHADRVPEAGEAAYITWELNDTASYTSRDDITVSKTQNPPDYPYIKINVYPDIDGKEVRFEKAEASVCAGEELALRSALPADVLDADGIVRSHDVQYILQDQTIPESEAKISSEGIFTASKESEYKIKARYGSGSSWITSEDTATVTVTAARQLVLNAGTGKIFRHAAGVTASYDVSSLISLEDQYKRRWSGETPQLMFQLTDADGTPLGKPAQESQAAAEAPPANLSENGILSVRINGTHYVKASVKGDPKNSVVIPVIVKQYIEAPAAEELTYNGKEQAASPVHDGYTLTGNAAAKAGKYKATATLDDPENTLWKDTKNNKPRQVSYTIAKAANPMAAAGKTCKVKYKKLKKKSQKISAGKAYTIKGQKGKLSFRKISGNKKIKIAKSGSITIKKGLKKGTYKVKAEVTAAGNSNYKKAKEKVTVTIRVK